MMKVKLGFAALAPRMVEVTFGADVKNGARFYHNPLLFWVFFNRLQ